MRTTKRDRTHRLWYGVAAVEDGRVERRLDGLTTDSRSAERLVNRLNDGKASLVHFSEVIDDFLIESL